MLSGRRFAAAGPPRRLSERSERARSSKTSGAAFSLSRVFHLTVDGGANRRLMKQAGAPPPGRRRREGRRTDGSLLERARLLRRRPGGRFTRSGRDCWQALLHHLALGKRERGGQRGRGENSEGGGGSSAIDVREGARPIAGAECYEAFKHTF